MISDVPHRVDSLHGRASRNKHLFACKILLESKLPKNVFKQHLRLRHSAVAVITVCKHTSVRSDHLVAETLKLPDIVLHNRIVIHIVVHGRGYHFLARASHDSGGEHIVSNAVCYLSDNISGSRSDHNNVSLLCKSNVFNTVLKISVKSIYKALVACEGFKSDRVYKLSGVLCHEYLNIATLLFEQSC